MADLLRRVQSCLYFVDIAQVDFENGRAVCSRKARSFDGPVTALKGLDYFAAKKASSTSHENSLTTHPEARL